jgi:hypothetical protein
MDAGIVPLNRLLDRSLRIRQHIIRSTEGRKSTTEDGTSAEGKAYKIVRCASSPISEGMPPCR